MPWWDTDITTYVAEHDDNLVAVWPLPGGVRVDPKFKMIGGDPACSSRASRHLFTWMPFLGGPRYFALIDVLPSETPFVLVGDTGQDPDGRVMKLTITDYQIDNPHPDYSETGIGYKMTLSLPGKTDWNIEWFWPSPAIDGIEPAKVSIDVFQIGMIPARVQNDAFGSGTAWESSVASPINWHTISECHLPSGEEKIFSQNFARFNGIDAYIALDDLVPQFNSAFVVECDFRYQGQPDWAPIWGKHATGGFFGFDEHEVIFGSLRLNTSWVPEVNVWYHYEYRFEQSGQLGHQQLIDDVIVMDATTNRQSMDANRLGVYRHTVPGTIWGHFDLKHLTYRKGTPGAFTTHLDMPLQTDALDQGPFSNHGTTFNMELPSV